MACRISAPSSTPTFAGCRITVFGRSTCRHCLGAGVHEACEPGRPDLAIGRCEGCRARGGIWHGTRLAGARLGPVEMRREGNLECLPINEQSPQPIQMTHTSGCRCGAVRFEASAEPHQVSYCHCSDCRRASGAPVSAFVGFKVGQVALDGRALKTYENGPVT